MNRKRYPQVRAERRMPTRLLAAALKLLATGTFALVIAACYGVVMRWKSILVSVRSQEGTPIAGLQVSLLSDGSAIDTEQTDTKGSCIFSQASLPLGTVAVGELAVEVRDIDGEANGGRFQEKVVPVEDSPVSVTLDRG